jgi:hypothetical protein
MNGERQYDDEKGRKCNFRFSQFLPDSSGLEGGAGLYPFQVLHLCLRALGHSGEKYKSL